MGIHPSHKTHVSLSASSYDEICEYCGATDELGGWGQLAYPCSNPPTACWKKVSFKEVCQLLQGREVVSENNGCVPGAPHGGNTTIFVLDNGIEIAGCSDWSGPYSEVTPDVDAHPPEWFINLNGNS